MCSFTYLYLEKQQWQFRNRQRRNFFFPQVVDHQASHKTLVLHDMYLCWIHAEQIIGIERENVRKICNEKVQN